MLLSHSAPQLLCEALGTVAEMPLVRTGGGLIGKERWELLESSGRAEFSPSWAHYQSGPWMGSEHCIPLHPPNDSAPNPVGPLVLLETAHSRVGAMNGSAEVVGVVPGWMPLALITAEPRQLWSLRTCVCAFSFSILLEKIIGSQEAINVVPSTGWVAHACVIPALGRQEHDHRCKATRFQAG